MPDSRAERAGTGRSRPRFRSIPDSSVPDSPWHGKTANLTSTAPGQLDSRKEVADFKCRRFGSIGSVNAVAFNAGRKELANRSRRGIGRVSRAHYFPKPGDDIFTFKDHHERASGTHETREA